MSDIPKDTGGPAAIKTFLVSVILVIVIGAFVLGTVDTLPEVRLYWLVVMTLIPALIYLGMMLRNDGDDNE